MGEDPLILDECNVLPALQLQRSGSVSSGGGTSCSSDDTESETHYFINFPDSADLSALNRLALNLNEVSSKIVSNYTAY